MPEEELASSWISQRGQVIELPSGNKARVIRTMSMTTGVKNGTIPNPLRSVLSKMIETNAPMNKKDAENPEVIEQMNKLMVSAVCEAMVNPRVVVPPEDENWETWYPTEPNTISIVDMSPEDRVFVYGVAQGGTTDLKSFREQQEQFMASLADESEVPVPPKRASRSNGGGKRSRSVVSR